MDSISFIEIKCKTTNRTSSTKDGRREGEVYAVRSFFHVHEAASIPSGQAVVS